VPHLNAVLGIDDPDVLGACLSGAGPSVAVFARREFARVERVLEATCEAAGAPVIVRTLAAHQHGRRDGRDGREGQAGLESLEALPRSHSDPAQPWRTA
jgi:hypothetical protein